MFSLGLAQNNNKLTLGFSYGFGSELNNNDYEFSNQFYKAEFHYLLKKKKSFKYEFILEPELNNARHKLINPDFISMDDPKYQEKWDRFSNGVSINQYIVNLGILVRKPIFNLMSIYFLGSAGPMIVDTETERQAKGFSFSHNLAIGLSVQFNQIIVDIRPAFRHVSNARINTPNKGYNTTNIQFGVAFPL